MKLKNNGMAIYLLVMGALLMGCDTATQQANSNQGAAIKEKDSQPNLSLHKPKTFAIAVQRLKQLDESLLADGDFPAPSTIKYVEVIHGTGASGHSHYYTAESYDAHGGEDKHDDHHEEDETVKRRSVEIGLRREVTDIAGWLPDIAAQSNLNESGWNSVKFISSQLAEIIDSIPADASDETFRESWKLKSKEIKPMLNELQTLVDSSSGDSK